MCAGGDGQITGGLLSSQQTAQSVLAVWLTGLQSLRQLLLLYVCLLQEYRGDEELVPDQTAGTGKSLPGRQVDLDRGGGVGGETTSARPHSVLLWRRGLDLVAHSLAGDVLDLYPGRQLSMGICENHLKQLRHITWSFSERFVQ